MAREVLQSLEWEEGKEYPVVEGPYRHTIKVLCSSLGRQTATFANGEHRYFGYVVCGAGNRGAITVPVLPDGRLLMVVEQRPPQGRAADRSHFVQLHDRNLDLCDFGSYSSLEFPGGEMNPNENVATGALREVLEETGSVEQNVELYRTKTPHWQFGSDATAGDFHAVAFLSNGFHADHVSDDGGLHIFAVTPEDAERNIQNGVIVSGQAGIMPYFFFEKVLAMRAGLGAGWERLIVVEHVNMRVTTAK